jgi:starch synthase
MLREELPPLHEGCIMNNTRFKILMVSTEAVPFVKEGGVADVMGSLPRELSALGHQVSLFLPRYGSIDATRWSLKPTGLTKMIPMSGRNHSVSVWQTSLPDSPVTVYLLDNNEFFGQRQQIYLGLDQRDEQRRFLLFCRSLLEALPELGFVPDIFHLNDWQTAPCAAYLRTTHRYLLRQGMARITCSTRDAGIHPSSMRPG